MSKIYETRLRKEFFDLQLLQRHPSVREIIHIEYNPRSSGNPDEWVSILNLPSDGLFPHRFLVTYCMPMYIEDAKYVRDWYTSFVIDVGETELLDQNSNFGVSLYDGIFTQGTPYNNHASQAWLCTGTAGAMSRGMGLWYFIICIGCLLNQEKFIMDCSGKTHLNGAAYTWWVEERSMKPNSEIDWPFHLLDEKPSEKKFTFGSISTSAKKPVTFTFGKPFKS